jgi:ankyrin repeat protein
LLLLQGELRARELHTIKLEDRDHRLRTPLMWAAAYGQTPTVALLVRHGASVYATADESETALHLAASSGHHDVVRLLVQHGAHVDALDENACTPLMFAAVQNHPHCVHELLASGADVTKTNVNDDSAISLAIRADALQAQAVLEQHILGFMKDAFSTAFK